MAAEIKFDVTIRPLQGGDQEAARSLILDGLREHFGFLDATLNPDLDDISWSYPESRACFVVATIDERIVGTGALIEESPSTGRLVRMSVSADHRGRGIGRKLVDYLVQQASTRGYHTLVCETNHDWTDATALYQSCGFEEIGVWDGDRHFSRSLEAVTQPAES